MPPLNPNATVPVPAPTAPSSTGPPFADVERGTDLVPADVPAPAVVEEPVVGLGHQRVDRPHVLVAGRASM